MKTIERRIAYIHRDGKTLRGRFAEGKPPTLVYLPGFRSRHDGTKACAVAQFAQAHALACLRFDYIGHGESDGAFADFRLSEAIDDSAGIIGRHAMRPIFIGSSMGGLIALELARRGLIQPAGMLLIAPAIDLAAALLGDENRLRTLKAQGWIVLNDLYRPECTYTLTWEMMVDALKQLPPNGSLEISCPVRILHGENDTVVPPESSLRLVRQLPNATLRILKGADHRLTGHLADFLQELEQIVMVADRLGFS